MHPTNLYDVLRDAAEWGGVVAITWIYRRPVKTYRAKKSDKPADPQDPNGAS